MPRTAKVEKKSKDKTQRKSGVKKLKNFEYDRYDDAIQEIEGALMFLPSKGDVIACERCTSLGNEIHRCEVTQVNGNDIQVWDCVWEHTFFFRINEAPAICKILRISC